MKEKIWISLSIIVVVLVGALGIWQVTAPCDQLQKWLPFGQAQNRCVEPAQQVETQKPVIVTPKQPKLVEGGEIEARLNDYRVSQGLAPLADSTTLDLAAQERAEGMCRDNNWSHNGDWAVLEQYYDYSDAGENLYYGNLIENQARDAVDSWVASPGHLKNIVGKYTQFGIGVKFCPGFQGASNAVIVTNYFGVPK